MPKRDYHGYLFTKHALERCRLRSVSQDDIVHVLQKPDRTRPGDKPESVAFTRTLRGRRIEAVGTYLKDEKKWLIISVWVRGEQDPTPFVWRLLTAPFRLLWWLLRRLLRW